MHINTLYKHLLLCLCFTSYSVYGQKLTKTEWQILQHVEENHPASIRFLEQTVNINSGTFNPAGVREAGIPYKKMLDEMGFTTTWVDMPESMNRGGHLIGEIKGKKGKKLLLIGHIDTVFEPDSPFQTWQQKDSVAYGPGANDMKGGNMVMLYALKALQEAGQLKDRQIIVILHGDEENPGAPLEISRKHIVEAAKRSDIALGFETGTGFNYATVARRGSSSWTLTVKGRQAHSSGIFSERTGAGAIYEASRVLNRFYDELQEEYLTFNPGLIVGGTEVKLDESGTQASVTGKTNLVANTAIVKGDLRFLTEEQKLKAREKMKAIVAESLPQTSAEITFKDGYPAMPPTEGNIALLQKLNEVSISLGQGEVNPYDPGRRGAGDISFVAQYVDGLDGLGVQGGNAHNLEEYVHLNSIKDIVKRTALFINRLTNKK
ncbi:glutamate carboxypeptidase [Pontibacter aydingkolensis]|uniref:M20/M25/M40 family metallo-hydrolase n=1 Tax=Pontibacter aydingkolensis TaxID=1911536 RepID=A0ABS7CY25_9BACT|nr:M20/M25/M40 family metallo-hydrolase [Pontibacter aydingkolensis]MBW7468725.1 M20/M25/M40 family metallo-hydrolase [Pontibacter aydingkolensis]